ncbi:tubulin-specific chaperone A-like [Dreissena polymorpha]|uniref:Tubulin-specific chaperone A n=1 Tax=Dreissena polymorpha TaxID=45954 RepID=A0A9D4QQB4_DREPO|nr:tubulin-specific chaperone A-like [Dreissena polymorpha]KAH3839474.1 hypothetical protein DPMN_112905 [Dreissena polymorpha]
MADQRLKQIKIKTGVVKRLAKEKVYYEKEVGKEEERYEKLKREGGDDHVLRKQTEVINESKVMIPDTRNRLVKASEDLRNVLDTESDLNEANEYKEALKVLEEADSVLAA